MGKYKQHFPGEYPQEYSRHVMWRKAVFKSDTLLAVTPEGILTTLEDAELPITMLVEFGDEWIGYPLYAIYPGGYTMIIPGWAKLIKPSIIRVFGSQGVGAHYGDPLRSFEHYYVPLGFDLHYKCKAQGCESCGNHGWVPAE